MFVIFATFVYTDTGGRTTDNGKWCWQNNTSCTHAPPTMAKTEENCIAQ